MTKKEYLLKILGQLEPVWELASGLEIIVEQGALGENVLDVLIEAVESGIHSARSENSKNKLKKGLDALGRVKQFEQQSSLKDEKQLVELDRLINSF